MKIDRSQHDEMAELLDDVVEYISSNYFPISGEICWKIIECISIRKQAEIEMRHMESDQEDPINKRELNKLRAELEKIINNSKDM